MKKYITVAAFLAAGTAFANAEDTFDATKVATITLSFNVDALEAISDVSFAGKTETPDFFTFAGTWADGDTGSLGLANNGSSSGDTTGFYSSWVKGDSSGKAIEGLPSVFTSETDWTTISKIALAYSFNTPDTGATVVTTALAIAYTDGTVSVKGSQNSDDIVFSGESGFTATSLNVTDAYVTSYEYSAVSAFADVATAEKAALAVVPEPSAFGMLAGLGALALVASRRRRK